MGGRGHSGDAVGGRRSLLCLAWRSEGQGEWGLTPAQYPSIPPPPPQGLWKVPMWPPPLCGSLCSHNSFTPLTYFLYKRKFSSRERAQLISVIGVVQFENRSDFTEAGACSTHSHTTLKGASDVWRGVVFFTHLNVPPLHLSEGGWSHSEKHTHWSLCTHSNRCLWYSNQRDEGPVWWKSRF